MINNLVQPKFLIVELEVQVKNQCSYSIVI